MQNSRCRRHSLLAITMIAVLLAGLISPLVTFSRAEGEFSAPLFEYELRYDGSAVITGCEFYGADLEIPSEIDGHPVKAIGGTAFSFMTNIMSVSIPEGVREIGTGAFQDCINLNSISLPDTGIAIGNEAFGNTGYANTIGNWTGYDTEKGTDLVLYIGSHLITAYEDYAGICEIREGTKSIADNAFADCQGLTDVVIPESVEVIGSDAFNETAYYKDETKWQDGGLYSGVFLLNADLDAAGSFTVNPGTVLIASGAFAGCMSITEIILPDGLTRIGDQAFSNCRMLTAIAVPETVTAVDNYAFFSCAELSEIHIPATVTEFGIGVFSYCEALKTITVSPESQILSAADDGILYNRDQSVLVQYPLGKEDGTFLVPDHVKRIGPYAFAGSDNLSEIRFPDALEEIGNGAFENTSAISSVTIPDSVVRIGEFAFADTESLSEINLPEQVIEIGERAFNGSAYYKNMQNWTDHVLYIGKHMIRGYSDLSGTCTVRDGTLTIAEGACRNCEGVEGLVLPQSLKRIGKHAFNNCKALKNVRIADGVFDIDRYAFFNCSALKEVFIPGSVTEIGRFAFGFFKDPENGNTPVDGFSIRGVSGSAAETYASVNGFPFTVSGIRIENGMAQETVAYSDPRKEGYSNADSDILRFCVYVETDYDTDLDGKPDLVKALIQVPRSAANGEYKAPVIYEASPYIAGMSRADFNIENADPFDESLLHSKPEKRAVSGLSDTFAAAASAKKEEWSYQFPPYEEELGDDGIMNLTAYDDFLIRGFAVVLSAGLGTYGSEGIECCGSVMERDAFKSVAEWLHGDRKAFTDKENNIEIRADWSSGNVGMIGFSYSATMAYEVAATGVPGVETIVDVAGISSWYDYVNSQGICTNFDMRYDYMDMLALTCASRFFIDFDRNTHLINERYLSWLRKEQDALRGDYGDFWAATDYYTGVSDIRASALIIHGLNDRNVKTKQFDLMRSAFLRSGCEVKTILHQNSHQIPWYPEENTEIMIGEHSYTDWLNLWFCHYLLGVENEVTELSDFMVQSNVNGEFFETDDYDTGKTLPLTPEKDVPETVQAKDADITTRDLLENTFNGSASDTAALWTADVSEPVTINGKIPVHLRVKSEFASDIELSLSAFLVDSCETPFMAYDPVRELETEPVQLPGDSVTPKSIVRYKMTETKRKLITFGRLELRNPDASYEPATAVKAEEPVRSGEYYDYTVWLYPNYYTLQPGHRLELYIVPFGEYGKPFLEWDRYTEEQMREMGMNPDNYIRLSAKYSFTIDNALSSAQIPVTKDSASFAPKGDTPGGDGGNTPGKDDGRKTPDTGDNSNMTLWIVILIAAVVAIGITVTIIAVKNKKRK